MMRWRNQNTRSWQDDALKKPKHKELTRWCAVETKTQGADKMMHCRNQNTRSWQDDALKKPKHKELTRWWHSHRRCWRSLLIWRVTSNRQLQRFSSFFWVSANILNNSSKYKYIHRLCSWCLQQNGNINNWLVRWLVFNSTFIQC